MWLVYKSYDLICKNCNKKFKGKGDRKYCSTECFRLYSKKCVREKLLSGDNTLHPRHYKEYLVEIHGEKCEKCEWAEVHNITGNVPIQLHHIDGNSDNNKLDNLELLCPNCHALTDNYGSLNRNGQSTYRKKYRNDRNSLLE